MRACSTASARDLEVCALTFELVWLGFESWPSYKLADRLWYKLARAQTLLLVYGASHAEERHQCVYGPSDGG